MRDNTQFKALVYEKAEVEKVKVKKKQKLVFRGICAFTVCFVIISAVVFETDIFSRKSVNNSEADLYTLENGAGKKSYDLYYSSLFDGAAKDDQESLEVSRIEAQAEAETFSYAADCNELSLCDIFVGATGTSNEPLSDILTIAKKECKINYNTYESFYDESEEIWKIVFINTNSNGENQSVYIDKDGKIKMIVFGE